jgi:hypothetical protein
MQGALLFFGAGALLEKNQEEDRPLKKRDLISAANKRQNRARV